LIEHRFLPPIGSLWSSLHRPLCGIAGSVETQFPDRIEKFVAAGIAIRLRNEKIAKDIGSVDNLAPPNPMCCAYSVPAVLKRERSQSGSAYCRRRIPSRSSMMLGRQRACQAAPASASAFCCSGVRGGAARMTLLPLMTKSVDWLGVSGPPAAAAALPDAGAAAAFVGCEAPAPSLWSVADCCADAVETPAATMIKAVSMVRILQTPPREKKKSACRATSSTIQKMLSSCNAGGLPHQQRNASNSSNGSLRYPGAATTRRRQFVPAAGTLISAGRMIAAAITSRHSPANACSMVTKPPCWYSHATSPTDAPAAVKPTK
jgi:hypothetical protein